MESEDEGQDCPTTTASANYDEYQKFNARAEALRLAVGRHCHGASAAEDIVKDARTFESFLLG